MDAYGPEQLMRTATRRASPEHASWREAPGRQASTDDFLRELAFVLYTTRMVRHAIDQAEQPILA